MQSEQKVDVDILTCSTPIYVLAVIVHPVDKLSVEAVG